MTTKTTILKRFTSLQDVLLTKDELIERGQQLAEIEQKMRSEEDHAEKVKRDLKSREAALILERSRLAGIVRTKSEPREVDCFAQADYDRGVYDEVRADTGEPLPGSQRRLSGDGHGEGRAAGARANLGHHAVGGTRALSR